MEELPNGLKVVLIERPNIPLVTVEIAVGSGWGYEDTKTLGFSHFVEHILLGDTQRWPGYIWSHLMDMGAIGDGYTLNDIVIYWITAPSDHFEEAFDLLCDHILNPLFDPAYFEREREVIISEGRESKTPRTELSMLLWESAYSIHPYGVANFDTMEAATRRVTRDELKAYYDMWYVPQNMALLVVGDFNRKKALNRIKERFGQMERRSWSAKPLPQESEQLGIRRAQAERRGMDRAYLEMGWHIPPMRECDVICDVLVEILSGGTTSRLYPLKDRVVDIQADWSRSRDPGLFTIYAEGAPDQIEGIEEEIMTTIERDITDEELDRAKLSQEIWYEKSKERVDCAGGPIGWPRMSYQLGYYAITWDVAHYLNYVERINALTTADVSEFARRYFKNYTVATILPEGER